MLMWSFTEHKCLQKHWCVRPFYRFFCIKILNLARSCYTSWRIDHPWIITSITKPAEWLLLFSACDFRSLVTCEPAVWTRRVDPPHECFLFFHRLCLTLSVLASGRPREIWQDNELPCMLQFFTFHSPVTLCVGKKRTDGGDGWWGRQRGGRGTRDRKHRPTQW